MYRVEFVRECRCPGFPVVFRATLIAKFEVVLEHPVRFEKFKPSLHQDLMDGGDIVLLHAPLEVQRVQEVDPFKSEVLAYKIAYQAFCMNL